MNRQLLGCTYFASLFCFSHKTIKNVNMKILTYFSSYKNVVILTFILYETTLLLSYLHSSRTNHKIYESFWIHFPKYWQIDNRHNPLSHFLVVAFSLIQWQYACNSWNHKSTSVLLCLQAYNLHSNQLLTYMPTFPNPNNRWPCHPISLFTSLQVI